MANPLVSAILPFHGSDYITEAVESVHAQTYPNVELVLVDDASPDDTLADAMRACDGTLDVVAIRREVDSGDFPTPTNQAAAAASGDYYAFCLHDDRWLPAYLARHVEAFADHPPCVGLQWTGAHVIDAEGVRTGRQIVSWPRVTRERMFMSCWVPTPSACMVRAEAFDGFDEDLQALADWDFYLRMWRDHALRSIDAPLMEFRSHAEQWSIRGWDRVNAKRGAFIDKHETLFKRAGYYQHAMDRHARLSRLDEAPWA